MLAKSIEDLIGNTPLIRLNRLSNLYGVEILAKCEFTNPTSSIKDRIAMSMINEALKRGDITKDTIIIEPTSGNTGIGLASICASKGLKLILTMPESMSIERQKILKFLGAKIVLTPAKDAMQCSIDRAYELAKELNGVVLQQFENLDNPNIHQKTTAIEILDDTDKNIDYFIASVGTGGTLTGVARVLKEEIKDINIVAVEPTNSAVLSGKSKGSHKIQGIGAGLIPKVLDTKIYNRVVTIDDNEAFEISKELAQTEGLLVGISSGANVVASIKVAKEIKNSGKTIVTILPDTAERYLSTELFNE